jgi:hypothetical protein
MSLPSATNNHYMYTDYQKTSVMNSSNETSVLYII